MKSSSLLRRICEAFHLVCQVNIYIRSKTKFVYLSLDVQQNPVQTNKKNPTKIGANVLIQMSENLVFAGVKV